jgi:dienelactone hydrolase
MKHLLLNLLFMIVIAPTWAADYAREQRWAEEVEPAIMVGGPVYLEAQQHKFLSIYTEAPNAKAAVIVVHGMGVHPNWGLIGSLRSVLPERGYATLAIQMPILGAEAKPEEYPATFPEAAARIESALQYLTSKGFKKIVVACHSLGCRMPEYFLTHGGKGRLAAWVMVGMNANFSSPASLGMPILDLMGSEDLPDVKVTAALRAPTFEGLPNSRQQTIQGADHFFNGKEAELGDAVAGFLKGAL